MLAPADAAAAPPGPGELARSSRSVIEIVAIDLGNLNMSNAHAYPVIEHQLSHLGTVNQYDLLHRGRVLDGLGTESRRCNEDSFARSLARQGTEKRLYLGAANYALPTFGLHVHLFQPQLVERDDSVNTAITRASHALKC